MKILITGSNGLLGQKLLHKLRKDYFVELIATSKGGNRVTERSNYTYFDLDITNNDAPSGVPADQRLIGTDAHRKYVEKMVPGSEWGKQFINKYRKK